MSRIRSTRLVALFDLHESLKSRKAIALVLMYLVVALAAAGFFIHGLNQAYEALTEQFGDKGTDALLQSERLVELVGKLLGGDEKLARALLSVPPLALFYGWLATNIMPLVVVATSADAICGEVASGSIRYALFRVDRLSWALGKLAGQALLMVVGIAIGAVATFVLGLIMLDRFEAVDTIYWLARMSGRASFYGFAYLGVAFCASQLVRSRAAARAIGIVLLFSLSVGGNLLAAPVIAESAPDFFHAVRQVFPNAHALDLFRPDLLDRGLAMFALVLIGAAWFALGFVRFSRRDA